MSIFIKKFLDTNPIQQDSARWRVVNGKKFFVLKKFNAADSGLIKRGVKNSPDELVFDNYGNIVFETLKYINPLVTNKPVEFEQTKTLSNIITAGGFIYKTSDKYVMSANMKYLLDLTGDYVYLLYNPLHRKFFRDYYYNLTAQNSTILGQDGRTQIGEFPLDTLFRNYCKVMTQDGIFIDPTCLCIESPLTCQKDAVFKVNTANIELDEAGQRKLSDIGNCCASVSPGCLFGSSLEDEDSFVPKFIQNIKTANSGCPTSFNYTDCSIAFDVAGNTALNESEFVQNCAATSDWGDGGNAGDFVDNVTGGGSGTGSGTSGSGTGTGGTSGTGGGTSGSGDDGDSKKEDDGNWIDDLFGTGDDEEDAEEGDEEGEEGEEGEEEEDKNPLVAFYKKYTGLSIALIVIVFIFLLFILFMAASG